ncbi:hypothetical protein, partial [Pseudomonas syringae]|uniref:hypothetical protein n=1 Tax=Pseudomonas syringae TaxID=317 RepID=UPI001EF9CC37
QRAIHGTVRLARRPASHPPDQRQDSAVTYVAFCVVSAIAVKELFFNYRATLRVACRSGRSASSMWRRVTLRFCKVGDVCSRLKSPFRPSATYFDGAKVGKPPGSVSGPTLSGSFALSLIRGPPQRAIHGTVRLARRPASHPPDQRQSSAVTYVALCVVSAIVIKKRFRLWAVNAGKD